MAPPEHDLEKAAANGIAAAAEIAPAGCDTIGSANIAPNPAAADSPLHEKQLNVSDSGSSGTSLSGKPARQDSGLKTEQRDNKPARKLQFWRKKQKQSTTEVSPQKSEQDPLAHLPDHEAAILRRQLDVPPVKVNFFTLFRYATTWDLVIIAGSSLCAIAAGAVLPLMTVIFGALTGTFNGFFLGTVSQSEFQSQLSSRTLYFLYLAIAEFCTVYLCTVGFIYTGEHLAQKIREHYLGAILRQNVGFFDKLGAGEITTRITADTNLVQDGISEKIALTLTALATFVTAFVIGFVKYWLLTLILCSTIVAIVVIMGSGSGRMVKWNKASLQAYAVGGSVAEEVLSSIRNAVAFGTEDKLAKHYDVHLATAEYWGFRHKALLGSMLGCMFLIIYLNYGLAFWQGSRFLVSGQGGVNLQDVITILLAVMIGAFSLGNVAPNAQAFGSAVAAAGKIFATIDRQSPLDPDSEQGKMLDSIDGVIDLENVKMIYPSRPEVVVMNGVSLHVPASKTTALVGASGSGKSTIVGLVERFYDPVGGRVLFDGVDVRDINLRSLRRQISLVSQEPTLFGTTILGNIEHGLIGTEWEHLDPEKKMDRVIEAAKMANAHDFINELPEGYQTNVGERGFLLSGGQKQRIAIARAVVSDPRVLLLDEATSALDTKSEGVVQAALDKASIGRTTIIIAHRLSTIRHADNIVVMSEGRIVETGTHNELIEKQAVYYNLVEAQQLAAATRNRNEEEVELLEDSEKHEEQDGYYESIASGTKDMSRKLTRTTTGKSASSAVLKDMPEEKDQNYSLWTLVKLVASFNKEEWHIMVFGLFWSIIAGGGQPTQAVFFAKCITSMSVPPSEYGQLRTDINFWALMYLMLAFVILIAFASHGIAFAYCSERLVHRARDRAFRSMLRQDIGFFDRDENSAGALTTYLSTQTTALAGLSGTTLGTILTVLSTLISAFALSIAIGWKLALVTISTVPVLLACGFLRFWILARFADRAKKAYEKSASYACEATSAIRTVASLTREEDVWVNYHEQLVEQGRRSLRSILRSSTLYAASQSLMFLCLALGFWYGGQLISRGEYGLFQFFVCFSAVIFGAQSAGTIFSFAPDMGKAKQAAAELKKLLDRVPPIDTWSDAGETVEECKGAIEFNDVHFRYATRPEVPVLRGVNLSVKPGQYVALVGASGCGKSTTIGLLERFYDPLSGTITLDGRPINDLNVNSYRKQIALVSQEPTLYQGTIKENILLGSAKLEENVSDAEVETACRNANIWTFIQSLPDGLQTELGNKGVMLSGGQKQRVAIARALLRDPKVLLLDEATSALDSESEKIVQTALDQAAKGRTTIAVAHRLSTIQRADVIYVFDGGRVVEQGSHQELLALQGRYYELVNMQSLEKNAA